MALLAMEGAAELGKKVDQYLVNWYNNEAKTNGKKFFKDTFLVKNTCPRFTTGDGKGLILDSIRGKDLFILCDVGNYSIEYNCQQNYRNNAVALWRQTAQKSGERIA